MIFKPKRIRNISLVAATILSLPLPLGILTGFYLWTSPFILLNSVLALKSIVIFNIFGFAVLILTIYKDLWICRYFCPTGVLCDSISRITEKKSSRKLPFIHKQLVFISLILALLGAPILVILDPINIFSNFFNIFNLDLSIANLLKASGLLFILLLNVVFPYSWCNRLCPLAGFQHLIVDAKRLFKTRKNKQNISFSRDRRYLILGLIGVGLGLTFRKISKFVRGTVLRPPGALPEYQFKTVCARCGNCIKACPTNIIQSSFDLNDPVGILTPKLNFSQSYCLPDCSLCGNVCPSGAITTFTIEQKKQLFIGTAQIDMNKCLLTDNKECDRCKFYCEYDAIEIKNSDSDFSDYPQVITDLCVGCGACKIACPTEAVEINPIS